MLVSGTLERAVGGPSEPLTPSFKRRTVYGKVSRYKLDEYLQLFDFPTPSISAEKRFTTTVPLQRLFLMNSDFMQVQAEEFAKRVAGEVDNRARIKKAYLMAFGREPLESEIQIGLEYLKSEPLLEYEESKKRKTEGPAGGRGKPTDKPAEGTAVTTKTDMPPATPMPEPDGGQLAATPPMPPMGMGMMGGVMPGARRGPGGPPVPEVKYEPTAWGRYAKVLLSSSEFLFIN